MSLQPDIAVVAECADLETLARKAPDLSASSALWVGSNRHKGLAVFAFGEYRLTRALTYNPRITYAVPIHVTGPADFRLLAMWAHYGFAPLRMSTRGPTLRALTAYRRFLMETPSIVAGDLNNHVRWDKPGKAWSHARAVAAFGRLGLVSAYHAFEGVDQGFELHPTFYWRTRSENGPTYHIDYVFLPRASLSGLRLVRVGARADWIATGLSDHAPLIVDLDLGGVPGGRRQRELPGLVAVPQAEHHCRTQCGMHVLRIPGDVRNLALELGERSIEQIYGGGERRVKLRRIG